MDSTPGEIRVEHQEVEHYCRWSFDVIYCAVCPWSIFLDWNEPLDYYEAMILEHQLTVPVRVQVVQL